MKKILFAICAVACFYACNNAANKEEKAGDNKASDTKTAKIEYPYTLDEPYKEWQPGDQQHVVTAMKALQGYEKNDINSAMAYFGDSVNIYFDHFRAKMSNDSLKKFFMADRAGYADFKVKMGDWESVISKDKKDEWVTMWYKQIMTDKSGKVDSVDVIDDCKISNGKIVVLNEKIQHYPAPAKK